MFPDEYKEVEVKDMAARIQWLSDEVLRLVKALNDEKQLVMDLCAKIEKLERSKP
jgi:hypothetical protein